MKTKKKKIEELEGMVSRLAFENRKLIKTVISKNEQLIEVDDELIKKNKQIEKYVKMVLEMHDKIDDLEREVRVGRDLLSIAHAVKDAEK